MDTESVTLKLPRALLSEAQHVATSREVTIGHMVRQLLRREVDRQLGAKSDQQTDERLTVALQALLARDMADAIDWDDLTERLRPHGYEMRMLDGAAVLVKSSCGTLVCKAAELGFSYSAMSKRFGLPFSEYGHSMTHFGTMPAGHIDPTRHAMLTAHIEAAKGWPELINRFACEGMELRPMGADLGIYIAATGRHLCNTASVGARYKTLVKRYGATMPGHPHVFLPRSLPPSPERGTEVIENP